MHLFAGIAASGHIKDGIGYFGNLTLGMILANKCIYLQEWQLLDVSRTGMVILATLLWA
jgi:hypothetical protein